MEAAFSQTRLQPYIAARGSRSKGIELYTLNVQLCQALYPVLHTFEVTLRNAVHHAISGTHGPKWYAPGRFPLRQSEVQDINGALAKLRQQGKKSTPGRLIAELNLGFWTNLFNRHYEVAFWTPHRQTVFPHALPSDRIRGRIHGQIRQVRDVRNRIFHYEPIWNDPTLNDAYTNARKIVGWISPPVLQWLFSIDEFPQVYSRI